MIFYGQRVYHHGWSCIVKERCGIFNDISTPFLCHLHREVGVGNVGVEVIEIMNVEIVGIDKIDWISLVFGKGLVGGSSYVG